MQSAPVVYLQCSQPFDIPIVEFGVFVPINYCSELVFTPLQQHHFERPGIDTSKSAIDFTSLSATKSEASLEATEILIHMLKAQQASTSILTKSIEDLSSTLLLISSSSVPPCLQQALQVAH